MADNINIPEDFSDRQEVVRLVLLILQELDSLNSRLKTLEEQINSLQV